MTEPLHGNIAETESKILWSCIIDSFVENEAKIGFQGTKDNYYRSGTAHFVLRAAFDPETNIELWGHGPSKGGIDGASIIFVEKATDVQTDVYEIGPETIQRQDRPRAVDTDDVRKLRKQIVAAEWDGDASLQCAYEVFIEE